MKYRVDLDIGTKSKIINSIWFDSLWLALQYFSWKSSRFWTFTSSPPIAATKAQLFKGNKLVLDIKERKGFYPYYLKVIRKSLSESEFNLVFEHLYYNHYRINGWDKKRTMQKALECHKEIFAE